MKRVMILGQPGSGKSTLARKLGKVTGLPVVHMDHIHWKAGWVPRDDAEKMILTREAMAEETWIFEGGFSRTWDERAVRADTLIWLDVGLWRRLYRVTFRFFRYFGQSRPDLPEGCPEGNWREMWDFYKWIWSRNLPGACSCQNCLKLRRSDGALSLSWPASLSPKRMSGDPISGGHSPIE